MNRTFKGIVAALMAAVAIAATLALTACGSKTVLSMDGSKVGDVSINADGCDGSGITMTSWTQPEGSTQVTIHSELEKGALNIKFGAPVDIDAALAEAGESSESVGDSVGDAVSNVDVVVEFDATGTGEETFVLEPGDYSLTVTGSDADPATGTVTITSA